MKTWLRDNGLSLTLFALFAATIVGQFATGLTVTNEDQARHGQAVLSAGEYFWSGPFLSATFENWESEFLQMAAFVVLTAMLFQRGSPESKDPDAPAPQDEDPARHADDPDAPWPVRAGAIARFWYSQSLGLALGLLFVASFILHWINSARHAADDALAHREMAPSLIQHLGSAELWFESFQNWQSEFLSTAVLIVLAIFLRQRGSPESKPVGAPHAETGT